MALKSALLGSNLRNNIYKMILGGEQVIGLPVTQFLYAEIISILSQT